MYSETDIEAAVAAGALSPEAAAGLRDFTARNSATAAVDEEHFRLITGFNDIFVGIAAAILLFAVAWIGQSFGPKIGGDGPSPFAGLFVAATAWGLAEFFTKRRRMALPSIILLLAFTAGVALTALATIVLAVGEAAFEDSERAVALAIAASAAVAAAATWAHWRRFRVPITIAAGAATVAGVVMALIASAVGETDDRTMENIMLGTALVLGIGVFLFAMRWDASDPRRETRRSDVAFWLHLLAAPLIVHPIFSLLGLTDGDASIGEALAVLLVYVLLGITALAIDRRALLVSALAYVLFALISLFREFGAVELNIALAAFVIGSGLLLLSAFWHNARRTIVRPLPPRLQARLPVLDRVAQVGAAA
jgi:MFS family permease